jgi:uncharacterized membrane protein
MASITSKPRGISIMATMAAGLASVYPPGYPGLIASFYPVVGDWEIAGQMVSVVCGVLLLFPLYALCKELYGDKVALLACLLATISPYLARYAAHVRSESPFVLLATVAVGVLQGVRAPEDQALFLRWARCGARLSGSTGTLKARTTALFAAISEMLSWLVAS